MSAHYLPPITEGSIACLNCGCGAHTTLSLDRLLAVGFGDCTVTKNGEEVYSESEQPDCDYWSASDAEAMAAKDPDADWRISFHAPLYDAEYQRQGDSHWVLVKKGMGFA